MELMVHRRLLHDDAFGVGEALNETAFGEGLVVRGKHYLLHRYYFYLVTVSCIHYNCLCLGISNMISTVVIFWLSLIFCFISKVIQCTGMCFSKFVSECTECVFQ